LPPTTRNRKTTIIGRIVDVDYRSINRILSRGSFAESIVWRLQTYHNVHDFDAFKAVSEAIGKRNSITCYCGENFKSLTIGKVFFLPVGKFSRVFMEFIREPWPKFPTCKKKTWPLLDSLNILSI